MNTIFVLLLLASFVAVAILAVMLVVSIIKKKKNKTLTRNTGIATAVLFISLIGSILTTETEEKEVADEPEKVEAKVVADADEKDAEPTKKVKVDMTAAQDASIPFADRLAKIALELFSDTTVDGKERNITVDNMGEMYYLNMMFDDAVTKKGTVNLLNRQTVELFEVLQQIDGYETILLTWQANTSSGELTRLLTVTAKKSEIDAMDFENFDASKLKDHVTNYGLHKDLK